MVGVGLYGPLIGRLYHRFGARLVSFFGSLICIASLFATSKASNLYVMFVTYGALFGFGSGCIFMVTYIAVPRYFTKWRSLSLGLIAMGPGGGLFIMSPIVQLLFENFGWRGTFLCMAGIDSIMCLLAFVYRPIVLDSEKEELKTNKKDDKKFWDISILKHRAFLLSSLAGVVFYLVHYIPPVHMVSLKQYYRHEMHAEGLNSAGIARLVLQSWSKEFGILAFDLAFLRERCQKPAITPIEIALERSPSLPPSPPPASPKQCRSLLTVEYLSHIRHS